MLNLQPALQSLIKDRTHRFASLWRLTRTDGFICRYTNHDATLTYAGHNYRPIGGMSATAKQKIEGMRDRNLDVKGAFNDDAITFNDLRAGLYRQAQIDEMLVDWRYPWAEPFAIYRYWIINTTFTGEIWEAQVEGLTRKLKQTVGRVYGRLCDVKAFGDGFCQVPGGINAWTQTGKVVTGVNVPRRDFTTDLAETTNYFKSGYVRWTSGLNYNMTMEVVKSYGTAGRLTLWMKMPYNIEIGDTFNIVAGCDRTLATCRDKFDNVVNFRGFPWIPGTDSMIRTPDHKVS